MSKTDLLYLDVLVTDSVFVKKVLAIPNQPRWLMEDLEKILIKFEHGFIGKESQFFKIFLQEILVKRISFILKSSRSTGKEPPKAILNLEAEDLKNFAFALWLFEAWNLFPQDPAFKKKDVRKMKIALQRGSNSYLQNLEPTLEALLNV